MRADRPDNSTAKGKSANVGIDVNQQLEQLAGGGTREEGPSSRVAWAVIQARTRMRTKR
ncbi:hypothetical protein PHMEG_0009061 [Phytophthora megakarya]|uniref:Uncharacterized protein n=1 Tax=Phytophthora megakarya TaxID=4795 RepID=A0A225WH46_9STRA|nr:hypothetical protein PHMEG_0009061 [Phytophthora megakarya]